MPRRLLPAEPPKCHETPTLPLTSKKSSTPCFPRVEAYGGTPKSLQHLDLSRLRGDTILYGHSWAGALPVAKTGGHLHGVVQDVYSHVYSPKPLSPKALRPPANT